MNVLLIVETPNKAKTLRKLFPEFTVFATLGQFIDLIPEGMGTRLPDHLIQYTVVDGKQQVLSQLRSAATVADIIYVATNPDREGEAIAAHVLNALDKPHDQKVQRIVTAEITRRAIEQAIANKRAIDWPMVRAYEAQRVVERYIGYCVSSELTHKFMPLVLNSYMTSGRVQSVALKLMVDRQNAIDSFVPTDNYGISATVDIAGISCEAQWQPTLNNIQADPSKDAHDILANTHSLCVVKTETHAHRITPPQPLTTISYIRLISDALKLTTKQAMDAAQKLYELGLITYNCTHSQYVSPEFLSSLHEFAKNNQLSLPAKKIQTETPITNNTHGHECIRVTDISLLALNAISADDYLLQAVYQCIWIATLEAQLADGEDNETRIVFENDNKNQFVANITNSESLGWREAENLFRHLRGAENTPNTYSADVFELNQGESLKPIALNIKPHNSEAPKPYTEIALIEKLAELGIGESKIYANTIERIIAKQYVNRSNTSLQLVPELKGIAVINTLDKQFSFMAYTYAASLEAAFDMIATGETTYAAVVGAAWHSLEHEIAQFTVASVPYPANHILAWLSHIQTKPLQKITSIHKSAANITTDNHVPCAPNNTCPHCQKGSLRVTQFTQGEHIGKSFVGCSIFPSCQYFQMVQ
jgi:DNA topoisomerase-1